MQRTLDEKFPDTFKVSDSKAVCKVCNKSFYFDIGEILKNLHGNIVQHINSIRHVNNEKLRNQVPVRKTH